MIARKIHQADNQQLAAPVLISTDLDLEQVVARIENICGQLNANVDSWWAETSAFGRLRAGAPSKPALWHYHLEGTSTPAAGFISFSLPKSFIMAWKSKHVVGSAEWWLASYAYGADETRRMLSLTLHKWVVGDNGKIKNRDKYERLITEIRRSIAAGGAPVG